MELTRAVLALVLFVTNLAGIILLTALRAREPASQPHGRPPRD